MTANANSRWSARGGSANFAFLLINLADAGAELRYYYAVPQIEFEKLVNGQLADGSNDRDVPLLQ